MERSQFFNVLLGQRSRRFAGLVLYIIRSGPREDVREVYYLIYL